MSDLVPRKLTLIATELHHEVEQAEQHWQSAVQHAIRAGELLTEAKGQVKHGEWLPWLTSNFPGSRRTAQGYMRLAANAEDAQALAHLGIEGALKQLAAPNPNERQELIDSAQSILNESEAGVRALLADEAMAILTDEQRERLVQTLKAEASEEPSPILNGPHGVKFWPTYLEIPEGLTHEQWTEVGDYLVRTIENLANFRDAAGEDKSAKELRKTAHGLREEIAIQVNLRRSASKGDES